MRLRHFTFATLALAAIALVVVVTMPSLTDRLQARLIEAAAGAAGLQVTVRGPSVVTFTPAVRVTARDLDLADDTDGAFDARIERIVLELDPWRALSGRPVIQALDVSGARVRIQDGAPEVRPDLKDALTTLLRARIGIDDASVTIGNRRHALLLEHLASRPGTRGQRRIEANGSIDGKTFTVQGEVGVRAKPLTGGMGFPVTAAVTAPDLKLQGTIHGHVRRPFAGEGLTLQAEVRADDSSGVMALFGLRGVPAGRLHGKATLQGDLDAPRLSRLEVTLGDGNDLVAHVKGQEIALASGTIESLRATYQGPMPVTASGWAADVRSLSVDASLDGERGDYRIDVAHLGVDLIRGMRLEASGTLELPAPGAWGAAQADMRLDYSATDTSALEAVLSDGLATLAPWKGQARLLTSPAEWRLRELSVDAGGGKGPRLEVAGELRGPGGLAGLVQRLDARALGGRDTGSLNVTVDTGHENGTRWLLGVDAPALGKIHGHAHLEARGRELAVRNLDARSSGPIIVKVTGDVGELRSWRDLDLKATVARTSPEVLDRVTGVEMPVTGPVSVDMTLRRTGHQALRVDGELRVGESRFELALTGERASPVPMLRGRIHAASVDAKDFWRTPPAAMTKSPASAPASRAPTEPRQAAAFGLLWMIPGLDLVLRDELEDDGTPSGSAPPKPGRQDASRVPESHVPRPLPWRRLRSVDLDLEIRVDTLSGTRLSEGSLDLKLVNRNGRLVLAPATLSLARGSVTFHGVADARDDPPSLALEGRAQRLPIRELMGSGFPDRQGVSGLLDFDYGLQASGQSLEDLRAALGGRIRVLIRRARLPLRDLDLLSGNVLQWMGSWMAVDKQVSVLCAVADMPIENGIARAQTLYVRTDRSAAVGTGTIDLRKGAVDLTVRPEVSGLTLFPPATVRIHGSFESPGLTEVDASGVLLHYGVTAATDILFPAKILIGPLWGSLEGQMAGSQPAPCE